MNEALLWNHKADQLPLMADSFRIHHLLEEAPAEVVNSPEYMYLAGFAAAQRRLKINVSRGAYEQGVQDWNTLIKMYIPSEI